MVNLLPESDVSPCAAVSALVSDVSPAPIVSDSVCKVLAPRPFIF